MDSPGTIQAECSSREGIVMNFKRGPFTHTPTADQNADRKRNVSCRFPYPSAASLTLPAAYNPLRPLVIVLLDGLLFAPAFRLPRVCHGPVVLRHCRQRCLAGIYLSNGFV